MFETILGRLTSEKAMAKVSRSLTVGMLLIFSHPQSNDKFIDLSPLDELSITTTELMIEKP